MNITSFMLTRRTFLNTAKNELFKSGVSNLNELWAAAGHLIEATAHLSLTPLS